MELMNNLDTLVSMTNGLCQLVWNGNVEREVQTKISYECRFAEQALRCRLGAAGKGQIEELMRQPQPVPEHEQVFL